MWGKALVATLPSGLYYVLEELEIMAQKLGDEKKEQDLARMQRKEFKEELADNYARLPRRPPNRRRLKLPILHSRFMVVVWGLQ